MKRLHFYCFAAIALAFLLAISASSCVVNAAPTHTYFTVIASGTAKELVTHQTLNIRIIFSGRVESVCGRVWRFSIYEGDPHIGTFLYQDPGEIGYGGILCTGGTGMMVPSSRCMMASVSFRVGPRLVLYGVFGSVADEAFPVVLKSPMFTIISDQPEYSRVFCNIYATGTLAWID